MAEKYLVQSDGDDVTYEIERDGTACIVTREGADGPAKRVELDGIGDSGLYVLMVDNRPTELYIERRRGGAIVTIGRHTFDIDVQPWRPGGTGRHGAAAGPRGLVRITAPMTGSIVEVRCAAGDTVEAGDVLLVIESMKMNNELRAPSAGRVEAVPVVAAQRVKAGDLLVALQTEAS